LKTRVLILLLFLYNCSSPYTAKVIKVIDGDTILLENNKELRYIGIDSPETHKKSPLGWEETNVPFGKEAEEFNRKLVEGKKVRIEFDQQKTDTYGRLLGYVFIGETFVNKKLLQEGLAVLYTYPPNIKYFQELFKAQKEARQQKKGIWQDSESISPLDAQKFIGAIKSVKGKVQYCYCSKKSYSLFMGKEVEFKTTIFHTSFSYFKKIGEDICSYYLHRKICVTGRIRKYNIPEIIANVPEEIEIIQ